MFSLSVCISSNEVKLYCLTLKMLGNSACFLLSAILFQKNIKKNKLTGI